MFDFLKEIGDGFGSLERILKAILEGKNSILRQLAISVGEGEPSIS